MKILNVGALEILFIVLLALIILGPKNAVKALGDIGTWLRKLKDSQIWQDFLSTSREIQEIPKKMMDEAEDTDAYCLKERFISVTPIHYRLGCQIEDSEMYKMDLEALLSGD